MRQDELQDAGEKAGFGSRTPYRRRLYAGNGKETRQEFGVGGNEAQRLDGDGFRLLLS
jgi:hypothetical protein